MNHKDKKVNDAWFAFNEVLHVPVRELEKKKESLMTAFRGHLIKKGLQKCGAMWMIQSNLVCLQCDRTVFGTVYKCTRLLLTERKQLMFVGERVLRIAFIHTQRQSHKISWQVPSVKVYSKHKI